MKKIASALVLCLMVPSIALAAVPKGAVKLPSSKLFKIDSFFCGNVKGSSWLPGKKLSGGYFYSHVAEKANLSKQLRTASGKTKKKLQSQIKALATLISQRTSQCAGGPNPTPTPTPTPNPESKALKFDISGAVGLALQEDADSLAVASGDQVVAASVASSNLKKVKADGVIEDVLKNGSAHVKKILSKSRKLYVLFDYAIDMSNPEDQASTNKCLLAEVTENSQDPTCIESELNAVELPDQPLNPGIQFDDEGSLYYRGRNSDFHAVLRKSKNGVKTDLINENTTLSDFFVLPNGRVIIHGTSSTGNAFVRRLSESGGLASLYSNSYAQFVKKFPDGNVYVGLWGNSVYGVVRYLSGSDAADSQIYMGFDGSNGTVNPAFDVTPFCNNGQQTTYQGFCNYGGTYTKGFYTTSDNKVFEIAGYAALGNLMQVYPTLARPNTVVTSVTVSVAVGDKLALAGMNSSNKNVLTLFDTGNNSEIELIGASNEIEIYHLNYLADSNTILFDGLRFSDNKYIIGRFDLGSMSLSVSATGSSKLVDLQNLE